MRLHILTTDAILTRPDFIQVAESLLRTVGPNGALHLRSRTLTAHHYTTIAHHLANVSHTTGATLVINRRTDIALAANAPAVQLPHDALPITDVRRIAPTLKIGLSIHSIDEAIAATPTRPDWFIAGHIYPTTTHPDTPPRGLPFLTAIVQARPTPVIAIGGIKPSHLPAIKSTGAAGIAVISGIWDEDDPNSAATHYLWGV